MQSAKGMRVTVNKDGPYLVQGGVPLLVAEIVVNDEGESVGWRELKRIDAGESYALCRCGQSHDKPFCDYTHVSGGFEGTETAGHDSYMEQAVGIEGPGMV